MEEQGNQMLFALLRTAICGGLLTDAQKTAFSEEQLPELMELAHKHDVKHLLALGLNKNQLLDADGRKDMERLTIRAAFRYEQLNYTLEQLCTALESAQIAFMPLKGSVIRKYYAQPWLRTSCDIDILVHEEDLDRAVDYLTGQCGFIYKEKGPHDVLLLSENRTHFELHYTLIADGFAKSAPEVLRGVWEATQVKEGKQYHHEMTDAMFYFYHVAHMAKHFEEGGCGIKPFIDLWILDKVEGADWKKRDALLKKGGLLTFADAARRLSKVWLDGAQMDALSQQMENYILRGGVYGNMENRVTVQQQRKGGPLRYALSKIFIPYDTIKFHYPVLQKHRWLTPFMQVRRWCKLLFCGHIKRAMNELQYNSSVTDTAAADTQKFLKNIGL